MRWQIRAVIVAVLLILYVQTPSFQWLKSLTVMAVYSTYEANNSVLKDNGLRVSIPGGLATIEKDWYPFVITFNDDRGFSRYAGRDLRMTVLYNFGYFPFYRSYSSYYDVDSPYYNSFYGAYAVQTEDGSPFGFPDGDPSIEEMGLVPEYDMKWLVLRSIGNRNPNYDYRVTDFEETELLGEDGWYVFNADMTVDGAMHSYQQDYRAYLQYGRPPIATETIEDFAPISMKGRIYGKYIEEKDLSLYFYCIATSDEVIADWEQEIMAETKVTMK